MNIDKISFISGVWRGNGAAQYPTIETAEYSEELIIKNDHEPGILFYEQKTWIKNNRGLFDKPIYWESGFIIEKDEFLELYNVQKSGRMEVLSGKLNYNQTIKNFEIEFSSSDIFNDEKMTKSGRHFTIS